MSKIDLLTNAIILLITILSGVRGIYLGIHMSMNPDEKDTYLKKLKNTIIALILSISTFAIKEIAQYYFR